MDKPLENVKKFLTDVKAPGLEYVYFHISMDALNLKFSAFTNLLAVIKDVFSESTIVIPSFPFGSNKEYKDWVLTDPIVFDVRKTACKVNLFGEFFRRKAGAERTLNPIFPVALCGENARFLVENSHLDAGPFDKNTIFGLLSGSRSCVIGLGVDMNTNSFVHMIDDRWRNEFPYKLYSDLPRECEIYSNNEKIYSGHYYYLNPEIRRNIKPRMMHDLMDGQSFYKYTFQPFNAYSINIKDFINYMSDIAGNSFKKEQLPPWHIVS